MDRSYTCHLSWIYLHTYLYSLGNLRGKTLLVLRVGGWVEGGLVKLELGWAWQNVGNIWPISPLTDPILTIFQVKSVTYYILVTKNENLVWPPKSKPSLMIIVTCVWYLEKHCSVLYWCLNLLLFGVYKDFISPGTMKLCNMFMFLNKYKCSFAWGNCPPTPRNPESC